MVVVVVGGERAHLDYDAARRVVVKTVGAL